MVDVGVDPEQSLENHFDHVEEVFGEGDADFAWEKFLVIQLVLNPCHQKIDVFLCRNL